VIISNATPLIAFSRIGQLPLLRKTIAEPLVVPAAVAREISEYETGRPGGIDLAQESWLETRSVADKQQVRLLLPTLDRGEAEVIALGLEQEARLVLIDELIGRKVAESLGLRISGSVGILIRAKQLGEITAVKPLLEQMVRKGMYFSRRFLDAVLRQVDE
jgi:predicted nucleic acid-binding protein